MMQEAKRYAVGIGELKVSEEPDASLVAHGLGSCVAVIAHHANPPVAALLHAMLPEMREGSTRAPETRYADRGIELLVNALKERGADPARATFKLAGGAAVLKLGKGSGVRVGDRNVDTARDTLRRLGLRASAEDVGGTKGRTVQISVGNGRVLVRTLGSDSREL